MRKEISGEKFHSQFNMNSAESIRVSFVHSNGKEKSPRGITFLGSYDRYHRDFALSTNWQSYLQSPINSSQFYLPLHTFLRLRSVLTVLHRLFWLVRQSATLHFIRLVVCLDLFVRIMNCDECSFTSEELFLL